MRRTLLIGIVAGVAAVIVLSIFALGVAFGPSNNPCPSTEVCGNQQPFTIQVDGRVINPTWNPPYVVIDSIAERPGSPPVTLAFPRLDFWNSNYALTLNYCISYPSGNTYCTGKAFATPPVQSGIVPGSGQVGWRYYLYHNGPKGSYTIQVTLSWTMTGCNLGATCASGVVTMGAGFSV